MSLIKKSPTHLYLPPAPRAKPPEPEPQRSSDERESPADGQANLGVAVTPPVGQMAIPYHYDAPVPPLIVPPDAIRDGVVVDYHFTRVNGVPHTQVLLRQQHAAQRQLDRPPPPSEAGWKRAVGTPLASGGQGWRLVALVLLAILIWQMSALSRPPTPVLIADQTGDVVESEVIADEPLPTPISPGLSQAAHPATPMTTATPTVTATPMITATPMAPAGTEQEPAPDPPSPPPTRRVAHTGGDGVYLRATPRHSDHLWAWPDGTPLRPTGVEVEAEGERWVQVYDPSDTLGWVPATYLE